MQFSVYAIALLSTIASAAPTAKVPRDLNNSFNLVFTGVGTAPANLDALNRGTWFVASRNLRAELVSGKAQANLFYKYSPEWRIATASTGMVITPGGTATVPNGKPVELVNNNGTTGVTITSNASGIPTLFYDGGRFQACTDEQGTFLSFIAAGQRQLADCAPVELVSVCSTTGVGGPPSLGTPLSVSCRSSL